MKAKLATDKIYTGYLLILTVWIGTQLSAPLAMPDLGTVSLLTGGGVSVGIFLFFYLAKGKQKLIPAVILLAVFLSLFAYAGWQTLYDLVREYTLWIRGRGEVSENLMRFEYINLLLTGIPFILLALLLERFFLLKGLAGIGLAGYLIWCMIAGKEIREVTICLILLFVVSLLLEFLQNKESDAVVYLLPFLLFFFCGIIFAPKHTEPYKWQFVKEMYAGARRAVIILIQNAEDLLQSSRDGFGMAVTGFSGTSGIGTGVSGQDKNVMRLTLTQGKVIDVYLTGNVFDTFDGEEWTASGGKTENDHLLDTLETLYAIERFDGEHRWDYIQSAEVSITYDDLKTEYFFAPQKIRSFFDKENWKSDLQERSGQWTFLKKQGYGTSYKANFYQMNLGQPFWADMVEEESRYVYDQDPQVDMVEALRGWFRGELPLKDLSEEIFLRRAEEIHRQYTEGYEVSEEVSAFLAAAAGEGLSDYEKCRAIEQTLSGKGDISFTYTTSPGARPEGKEFLDCFLLESREGYCTYYATAFVLLVRELGMPARYVQGFCVSDDKLGKEKVTVTSYMAHAWPEVYFEGVGWIPFEPTPGYSSGRYRYWNPVRPADEGTFAGMPSSTNGPPVWEESSPVSVFDTSAYDRENVWSTMSWIIILVIVAAGGLLISLEILLRKRRYDRYSREEKVKEGVRQNLQILRLTGFRLQQGETLAELSRRILQEEETFSLQFINGFERIYYGNETAGDELIDLIHLEKNLILDKIKGESKRKYIWLRFRLLISATQVYK